ncbi:hypothetical protein DH2020_036031 [Rehmannia glutinosa]|uniref:Bifunctional inhibitor/plant lipid transfer protein/seed storage helical domain-containing protein n=1 Tax=Rehmannia glutinosa TaxID=99300 RepID=A0ABR0V5K1_REHGL
MFPSAACSDKLVTFSTCLPYVAVSPNNLTDSPPPQCCDDVSAAFGDGSAICLCYFVLRPKILGFPLNSTRLLSLTSVCPVKDQTSEANFSLETLCSGSVVLPPLQSITGPRNLMPPPIFGKALQSSLEFLIFIQGYNCVDSPPPPLMGSAEESSGGSSTEEPADGLPSPQAYQPSLQQFHLQHKGYTDSVGLG